MKEGPDIALIGALIGDPARANMLAALMSGKALTASELAGEAGVMLPTASAHLKKLVAAGLLSQRKQGRHRYFALHDGEVGAVLEAMMGLAARRGHLRTRTGPKDPAMRQARVCYDHLAGALGVQMYDAMQADNLLSGGPDGLDLTPQGRAFSQKLGITVAALPGRRPLCKSCLDWSARRNHLAGAMGAAIYAKILELGWASRDKNSRVVRFTRPGLAAFTKAFPPRA